MAKIVEYKVLSALSIKGLVNQVNEHLESGWKLQGGVAVHAASIYQAVIREEPDDQETT